MVFIRVILPVVYTPIDRMREYGVNFTELSRFVLHWILNKMENWGYLYLKKKLKFTFHYCIFI